mmetsp:Transcript_43356/g.85905  ORF Transcript_43356/g.85905 Transcript_43356/m.85905 type:complete len:422 (-) Transcript_43356:62-1327(-)
MACLSTEAFEWNLKCSGLLVGVALVVVLFCTAFCVVRLHGERATTRAKSGCRSSRCTTIEEPKKLGSSWIKCIKPCKATRLGKPTLVVEDLPPSRFLNESASLWRLFQLDDSGIVSSGGISYTVTEDKTAVTMGVAQASPLVGRLDAGRDVTVVELIEATHVKLGRVLRGRIVKPRGWITLESVPCKEAQSVTSDTSTATPQGGSSTASSTSSGSSIQDSTITMSEEPLTRLPPRSPCCAPGRRQREDGMVFKVDADIGVSSALGACGHVGTNVSPGCHTFTNTPKVVYRRIAPGAHTTPIECTMGKAHTVSGLKMVITNIAAEAAEAAKAAASVAVETLPVEKSQSSVSALQPREATADRTATKEPAQRKRHTWFNLHRLKKALALPERQPGPALDLRGAADAGECRRQMRASSYTSVVI